MSGFDNNSWTTTTVTAAYTATENDYVILCDPSGGAITVTLPTPGSTSVPAGREYCVVSNGDTNAVTIATAGAELINGGATVTLAAAAYHGCRAVTDGTDWWLTASY